MLEMIAFVSYLQQPGELDSRVNLTLTVFLGIIFFQIMLSELLPTTGYLTDMHLFTFGSTVLIALIAVSHVFIFGIQAKAVHKSKLLRRMALLRKSRRARPAAVLVQRQVRIHLARKSMQERKQQQTQVPAAAPGTATCVSPRVSPLGTVKPKEEAQAERKAVHAVISLFSAYHNQSKNTTVMGIFKEVNNTVELLCANFLTWINWIIAITFLAAYFIMLTTLFKGANQDCL